MLRLGNKIRLTELEVQEARHLGLRLDEVRTHEAYSLAVIALIETLALERPKLLEKIASALAVETGAKLPAKLKLVVE